MPIWDHVPEPITPAPEPAPAPLPSQETIVGAEGNDTVSGA